MPYTLHYAPLPYGYGVHTSPTCIRLGLFSPRDPCPRDPQFWGYLGYLGDFEILVPPQFWGLGGVPVRTWLNLITCVYTPAPIRRGFIYTIYFKISVHRSITQKAKIYT